MGLSVCSFPFHNNLASFRGFPQESLASHMFAINTNSLASLLHSTNSRCAMESIRFLQLWESRSRKNTVVMNWHLDRLSAKRERRDWLGKFLDFKDISLKIQTARNALPILHYQKWSTLVMLRKTTYLKRNLTGLAMNHKEVNLAFPYPIIWCKFAVSLHFPVFELQLTLLVFMHPCKYWVTKVSKSDVILPQGLSLNGVGRE